LQISAAQMDEILMAMHQVHPSKKGAFSARTRHLKRLGFPPGANVGRGRSVTYGASELINLLLAFEMAEVGINPERAVKILSTVRPLDVAIARDFLAQKTDEQRPSLIIQIDPRAMERALGDPDADEDPFDMVENPADFFSETYLTGANRFHWRRLALIDASQMMRDASLVLDALGICAARIFNDALQDLSDAAKAREVAQLEGIFDGHD
jgi:hypothetical protein